MHISTEFGKLLIEILGSDSNGKAAIRTGISKSYWGELLNGKVPRPESLEKIIDGYRDRITPEQIKQLYEAAGYEIPAKWIQPIPEESDPIKRVEFALNGSTLEDWQIEALHKLIEETARSRDETKKKENTK